MGNYIGNYIQKIKSNSHVKSSFNKNVNAFYSGIFKVDLIDYRTLGMKQLAWLLTGFRV